MSAAPRAAGLVAGSAIVFAVVLACLWPFRLYGFDPTDEGVQLVQIERVVRGERPQVDFETAYSPGYFAFHAALQRLAGGSAAAPFVATRTFGVVLQAATAALAWALAAATGGRAVASGATVLLVAFLLPVSLRFGAPFNIPYPGWLAMIPALVAQALSARLAVRRAGRDADGILAAVGLALGAGVAAGVAFSLKSNAGLLVAAGSALAMTAGWSGRGGVGTILAALVRGAAVAATLALLTGSNHPATMLALGLPVLLAALRGPASAAADRSAIAPLADLAALSIGFLLPVLPWAMSLVTSLGLFEAAGRLLSLGGSVTGAYLLPIAAPGWPTIALVAGLLAAAIAVRSAVPRAQAGAPVRLATGIGLAAVLAAIGEGARPTAENACLWLGPVLLALAAILADRGPAGTLERALIAFAALYQLQEFPRVDLIHVAMAAPPVLVALASAWAREARAALAAVRQPRRIVLATAALIATLGLGRMLPSLAGRFAAPAVSADLGPRAPVILAAGRADALAPLSEVVRELAARTAPGDAVFAFPDVPGAGWLAGRDMPWTFLYFVPGRPSREDEWTILAELDARRPAAVVRHASPPPAFAGADDYFARLVTWISSRYEPVAGPGEYEVLVPRANEAIRRAAERGRPRLPQAGTSSR